MVKERFKTFNIQFEELHQRQSQWTVPDSELRESLRLAVAEVLLPAYRSFIRRFGYVFFCLQDFMWISLIHHFFSFYLCSWNFGFDVLSRPMIENGKNPQKYIRFSPEDLERMLAEFFEGKTWGEQKRWVFANKICVIAVQSLSLDSESEFLYPFSLTCSFYWVPPP